jgi:hypothetical protein
LAGCDAGHELQEPTRGPPLRVVATHPADGAGFDCPISDLGCGVPINTTFQIRFDRYLLPSTAVRQSFTLYTGQESNVVPPGNRLPALTPRYDLVERVVSYELPPGVRLRPNTHYTAELVVPEGDAEFGFRAFDGAPLDEETTVTVSFLTSNQEETRVVETSPTCSDLVYGRQSLNVANQRTSTFVSCNSSGCHDADAPRMDLDLSSERGVVLTAIGRVAHQTETTPNAGVELQNPARFGAAMPRVDPGRPDNSYLMYKLLAAPENYRGADDPDPCATRYENLAVDEATCVPASADETERLRAWFLRGLPMPRTPSAAAEPAWLTREQLRGIQAWIQGGAGCP